MVLVTDRLEGQRGLTDQVVGCARHGQLRAEMAGREASERRSHRHGADDRDRGADDRLQPDLGREQRDHGRGERAEREEERVERLGVDLHAHEDQTGQQPDHPHPGQHAASVPAREEGYTAVRRSSFRPRSEQGQRHQATERGPGGQADRHLAEISSGQLCVDQEDPEHRIGQSMEPAPDRSHPAAAAPRSRR